MQSEAHVVLGQVKWRALVVLACGPALCAIVMLHGKSRCSHHAFDHVCACCPRQHMSLDWCSICAWGLAAVSARPAPLVCASAPVPAAGLAMRGGVPLSHIAEWALAAQCDEIFHIK